MAKYKSFKQLILHNKNVFMVCYFLYIRRHGQRLRQRQRQRQRWTRSVLDVWKTQCEKHVSCSKNEKSETSANVVPFVVILCVCAHVCVCVVIAFGTLKILSASFSLGEWHGKLCVLTFNCLVSMI